MAGLTSPQAAAAERLALGCERVMLVILDDAHPAPDTLRAAALAQRFARTEGDFYPGVRAAVPEGYATWLATLAGVAWGGEGLSVLRTSFAVARDDPADFVPIQRIPHVDTLDPGIVAAIHYLCHPPHGGTSLYRHRRTGYERIDRARQSAWQQALARDMQEFGKPGDRDLPADSAAFERIGGASLRFNRLIFYSANGLHAGDLANTGQPAASGMGRLTITSLLRSE